MNKKNITIDTEFFDDGIQAKLKAYHEDEVLSTDNVRKSKLMQAYRRSSMGNTIPGSRYEYQPDNQYSSAHEIYDMPAQDIKKLQSANNFENIISRAMANLFVSCWEQMKALLPQYSHLSQGKNKTKVAEQILEDYNNVFNSPQQTKDVKNEQTNIFSKRNQSLKEKKKQIIQRQRKGLTLDSLSKQKLNRSKSLKNKLQTKNSLKNKQQRQVCSRKSYREKFCEYKHRSKSKDADIHQSQRYQKFQMKYTPYNLSNVTSLNYPGQYSTTNPVSDKNSFSRSVSHKNINSKIQILNKINNLLMDRQEIYQGKDCNYFFNHRDSSRNMFLSNYQTKSYYQPTTSFSKIPNKMYNIQSTVFDSQSDDENQRIKTKLIQEIIDKLHYSKLRFQEIQKPKNEQRIILQRIDKLEKIILELKNDSHPQNQPKQQIVQQSKQKSSYSAELQTNQLFKKFFDQISSLKSQIKEIKKIEQSESHNNVNIDNQSRSLIIQQQKLLNQYQRQFQKLITQRSTTIQKEKPVIIQQIEPQKIDTAKKTIFDQLIEDGKTSQRKVTWNDGWQTQKPNNQIQSSIDRNNQFSQTIRKSRRTQHLNNEQGFQKYRYTRTQILQNIGLRAQVQEEQRLWRQEQARLQMQRQKRDELVKVMVNKVRKQRNEQPQVNSPEKNTLLRQKYEKQWQHYQKTRIDDYENENQFCSLFRC